MKLIVEGPDGSGKTCLLRQLRGTFNLDMQPRVVSKDTEAMVDLKKWVEEDVKEQTFVDDGGVVYPRRIKAYDRHRLISEPIYGPILRHEQQPGFDDPVWFYHQTQRFWAQYPTIIYCLPSPKAIHRNLMGDEDNTAVFDHWQAIYTAYLTRAALDKMLRPGSVFVYDYQNPVPTITHIFSHLYKQIGE